MRLIWARQITVLSLCMAVTLSAVASNNSGSVQNMAPALLLAQNSETSTLPATDDKPMRLINTETPAIDGDSDIRGVGARFFVSRDSEGFLTQRISAEYMPRLKHMESFTGIRVTALRYRQNDWLRNGQQLAIVHRNTEPETANGVQLEAGLLRQGGHDLLTANGSYHKNLAKRTQLELIINRDLVETVNALNQGVHFNFIGAVMEQELEPHITVVGMGARQEFSDGNDRNHVRIKLIAQPDLDLGLTLQLRYRTYTSSSSDVGLAYFNPSHYDETLLAVGWRQRINGWTTGLTAGGGQQHVAGDPGTPTRLLEFAAQGPRVRNHILSLRGGFNRSASFGGSDYRYHYLQGEWILMF